MRFLPRLAAKSAAIVCFVASPLVAMSCMAPPEAPPAEEATETTNAEIINGVQDTGHQAVVAVLGNSFSCTGTIIQVKNGKGYVLTAAHCCVPGSLPTQVAIGNNFNSAPKFSVVNGSVKRDGCYSDCPGSTNDVCMLQFNGATGSTPVIPVMTTANDNLAVGTPITYVGYGVTENGGNTIRRKVDKTIGALDSYFVEYANPQASGTCQGDSGGPGLVLVNGVEHVACVTSFGDQNCTAQGASIRSRAVYTNFIAPYLADQNPINGACPVETDCNLCIGDSLNPQCGNSCVNAYTACDNDNECGALLTCYGTCGTKACENDCNSQHLGGLQQYEKLIECICDAPCQSACGQDPFCTATRCGYKPSQATAECKACSEANCCEEAFACFDSASCKKCFTSQAGPECATDQEAVAYYQCVSQSCSGLCPTLQDPGSHPSMTTTTSTGAATSGAGGVGGAGATSTSAAGGGKEPQTVTECACQNAGSGDYASWPWVVGIAGVGLVIARRRRAAR